MSIAVDDQLLNWKKPESDTEKWVAKEINELTQTKKRILFQRQFDHSDRGILITRPQTILDCVEYRNDPITKKREKWIFTDPSLYNKDTKAYKARQVSFQLSADFNVQQDPERAFFFYRIFEKGMSMAGFKLKDYDIEAKEKNTRDAVEFEVGNLILNKLNEADIKLRCNALSVVTEDKSIDRLRRELFDKVKQLEKDKTSTLTLKKFVKEAETNSEELILRAYANESFWNKVLFMENMQIRYTDSNTLICTVPAPRIKEYIQHFVDFLLKNKEAKETFLLSAQGTIEEVATTARDFENVSHIATIKNIATKDYNIPIEDIPQKATVDDVKNIIREKVSSLA